MEAVSGRDLEALRWVDEQYAVRVDQLARLLGRTERTVQRWTRRMSGRGWVELRRLLVDEPAYVWLTPQGRREARTGFGPWEPRVGRLAHVAAVVDVRLYLQGRPPARGRLRAGGAAAVRCGRGRACAEPARGARRGRDRHDPLAGGDAPGRDRRRDGPVRRVATRRRARRDVGRGLQRAARRRAGAPGRVVVGRLAAARLRLAFAAAAHPAAGAAVRVRYPALGRGAGPGAGGAGGAPRAPRRGPGPEARRRPGTRVGACGRGGGARPRRADRGRVGASVRRPLGADHARRARPSRLGHGGDGLGQDGDVPAARLHGCEGDARGGRLLPRRQGRSPQRRALLRPDG